VAAGLAGAVQAAVMGELGGARESSQRSPSGVVSVVIGLALLVVAKQSVRGSTSPNQWLDRRRDRC
jgi:hypothetical protein